MKLKRKFLLPVLKRILYLLGALTFVIAVGAPFADRWRYSRELGCQMQVEGRAREICSSVERHLEFTCCGHAIISPGFRPTSITVKNVWCELRIEQEDVTVLRSLAKNEDWRLVSTAESLLRLFTGRDQYGTLESETSIFHPANSSYLLKDRCAGKTPSG